MVTADAAAGRGREVALPGYRVTIAAGALDAVGPIACAAAGARRVAVISDATVARLYGARVLESLRRAGARADLLEIPPGESEKTRARWAALTDEMLARGCGRDTTVLALGGGVVGDLAGFVAATFMRGVPVVQVPTTLLAMIDASVGGKTGVDTPAGKNLVGAFHRPAAVVADPEVLATLPVEHLRAGLAEAIKHGVIADERYFERTVADLETLLGRDGARSDAMAALVARSVEIKASVVARDEREHGLRKVLNFGHTIGHAVEHLSGYALLHGEAVAVGMALESALAVRIGLAEPSTAERVGDALRRAELPTTRPPALDAERILAATRLDKKARGGAAEFALPARIGAMAGERDGWTVRVPDEVVLEVLR